MQTKGKPLANSLVQPPKKRIQMNKHKKLDLILKHMSVNIGEIPKRPDRIVENANLKIEKSEAYMMLRMLLNDGYVFEHDEKGIYGITYKGILFLENGGYTFEHQKYKLSIKTTKISNIVDIFLKPLGIITAVFIIAFYLIKFLKFFGVINQSIN